jgi:polysaccharide export outer membrane protein
MTNRETVFKHSPSHLSQVTSPDLRFNPLSFWVEQRPWVRGWCLGILGLGATLTIGGPSAIAQSMQEVTTQQPSDGQTWPNSRSDIMTAPFNSLPNSPGSLQSQDEVFGIPSSYRLGIGDVVDIAVFGAEEYSAEVIVLQDGTVNLPRVGQVFVLGLTFPEIESTVASRYSTYIHEPIVTITPASLRPVRVAVSGAVRRPGSYTVQQSGEIRNNNVFDSRFPTLTEAIAQAGGITGQANIRDIELRRPVGYDRFEVSTFNLWELIQSGDLRQDVVLQSGDEVFIPTAVAMLPDEATQIADASFAPVAINVYVAGEVERPGLQELPLNTPLNQAILNAGNFNPRANQTKVQLVRLNSDGTVTQQDIDVDFAAGINDQNNPILTDQDVVVVGRSGLARFGDATNIVLSPITRILNTVLGLERLLFD